MAFESVYQLSAALDYLLRIGVNDIERHTVGLAHRLHDGLSAQGHTVLTPPGNRSAIVAFEHGRDIDMVRRSLDDARIKLSFREGGSQLRAGSRSSTRPRRSTCCWMSRAGGHRPTGFDGSRTDAAFDSSPTGPSRRAIMAIEPPGLGILTGISYVSGLDYYRGINEKVIADTPRRHAMVAQPSHGHGIRRLRRVRPPPHSRVGQGCGPSPRRCPLSRGGRLRHTGDRLEYRSHGRAGHRRRVPGTRSPAYCRLLRSRVEGPGAFEGGPDRHEAHDGG